MSPIRTSMLHPTPTLPTDEAIAEAVLARLLADRRTRELAAALAPRIARRPGPRAAS